MRDDPRLFDAFDDCLARLAAGESVEGCLASYPDLAADLAPMLGAARFAEAAAPVPHHAQMRSRARFLADAAAHRPAPQRAGLVGAWLRRTLSTAITLAAGFMLGTTGLYYASASTLPGDSLYGIKRAFEDASLQLANDPNQRFSLEEGYDHRRAAEVQAVLAEDRAVVVNFGGLLTGRTETAWQIGGFNVQVTDETRIIGDPQPGFYVAVTAEIRAGTLMALQLESEEVQIIGVLQQSGGMWSIAGTTFSVGPETVVTGAVAPGVTAAARLRTLNTGERVAVSLVTLAPTPSPTPSPLPTASPTEQPTGTARPSATQAPTQTPLPPTATPTQAPSQQQPAFTSATAEDGSENANQSVDDNHSGSGSDDGNNNSGGDSDDSGSGGSGSDDGSPGSGDSSGSGGGDD